MPPTTLTPATRQFRRDLSALTGLAFRDLDVVWRQVETPGQAKAALQDVLPSLVDVYGAAAGALAADWYDDLRDQRGIARRFRAVVVDVPADTGVDALTGTALGSVYRLEQDWDAALTIVQGGLQRRIADAGRGSLMTSSVQDPQSRGWVRVGEGSCKSGWCDQYLDGEIRTVEGYDFDAHDWCQCGVEPVYF